MHVAAKVATLNYVSSVDGTSPLLADVAMIPNDKFKPLIVVMHGYNGSRMDVACDIEELATKGVVAVAPDMRGRGGSGGKWDNGGLDVHDILDAVQKAIETYPAAEIDARNLNIVGYSGGGGNAVTCAVRFPDLFRTCISFFGISDYAWWYRSGGRPERNAIMENALGGSSDEVPDVYEARNAGVAAGNALAKLHFFWDVEEKDCPPDMILNTELWRHGYRFNNPDLSATDDIFLKDILGCKGTGPELPCTGELLVNGYLVTRHFSVWIEDSKKDAVMGRVTVRYDLSEDNPVIKVVENPRKYRVSIDESPLKKIPVRCCSA